MYNERPARLPLSVSQPLSARCYVCDLRPPLLCNLHPPLTLHQRVREVDASSHFRYLLTTINENPPLVSRGWAAQTHSILAQVTIRVLAWSSPLLRAIRIAQSSDNIISSDPLVARSDAISDSHSRRNHFSVRT